jgi:hypothetical protein
MIEKAVTPVRCDAYSKEGTPGDVEEICNPEDTSARTSESQPGKPRNMRAPTEMLDF